jgi:hypothetical protein
MPPQWGDKLCANERFSMTEQESRADFETAQPRRHLILHKFQLLCGLTGEHAHCVDRARLFQRRSLPAAPPGKNRRR